MQKNFSIPACSVLLVLLFTSPVWALGMGGGFSAGSGESKWSRKDFISSNNFNSNHETTSNIGGGLVIEAGNPESACVTRFNIGLDKFSMETGYTENITRFNFMTTFRIIAARKDFFKFWIGPQVGIHYLFGRTGYSMHDHNPITLLVFKSTPQLFGYFSSAKYNMAGADAGLVIGFDFDIGKHITLSTSVGIKYGATVGGIAFRDGGLFSNNYLVYSHGFDRFADISVLFRFDDSHKEKQAEGAKTQG